MKILVDNKLPFLWLYPYIGWPLPGRNAIMENLPAKEVLKPKQLEVMSLSILKKRFLTVFPLEIPFFSKNQKCLGFSS